MPKKELENKLKKKKDFSEKPAEQIPDGFKRQTDEDVLTKHDPMKHTEDENERANGDLPK